MLGLFTGRLIDALVFGMAIVAAHPLPAHLVPGDRSGKPSGVGAVMRTTELPLAGVDIAWIEDSRLGIVMSGTEGEQAPAADLSTVLWIGGALGAALIAVLVTVFVLRRFLRLIQKGES